MFIYLIGTILLPIQDKTGTKTAGLPEVPILIGPTVSNAGLAPGISASALRK